MHFNLLCNLSEVTVVIVVGVVFFSGGGVSGGGFAVCSGVREEGRLRERD